MVTAFDQAMLVYSNPPTSRDFGADLLAHLRVGYVFSRPGGFVMFRPVRRGSDRILDLEAVFPSPNCWHVWLAAGDWRDLLRDFLPYPLPWISWERAFRLRYWRLEKLLAKGNRVSP